MTIHEAYWMHGNALRYPHFIKVTGNKINLIVRKDYEMSAGDRIESDIKKSGDKIVVPVSGAIKSVVERRPARGAWKDRPDFVSIEME